LKEAAMNNKTAGNRGLRRVGALGVLAAVAMLTTACGVVHIHVGNAASAASTQAPTYAQELALAQCMQGHGEPNFPDPSPSGGFSANVLSTFDNSQGQAAYTACRHLLADGGPSISQLQQDAQEVQQELQKQLPVLLKFSQCMRGHGVPDYPDPTVSGQSISGNLKGAAINPNSPQFQAALKSCQHLAPGLSFHSSVAGAIRHAS
jgi:hypothetical protein